MACVGSGRFLTPKEFKKKKKTLVFSVYWILELWLRNHGLVPIHF